MKSDFPCVNRKVFDVLRHLDANPGRKRPVSFWFCSNTDEKIFHLAAHLQKNGFAIKRCDRSGESNFTCIAERVMAADNESISRLCMDLYILAEKMEIDFDGWETMIELEE